MSRAICPYFVVDADGQWYVLGGFDYGEDHNEDWALYSDVSIFPLGRKVKDWRVVPLSDVPANIRFQYRYFYSHFYHKYMAGVKENKLVMNHGAPLLQPEEVMSVPEARHVKETLKNILTTQQDNIWNYLASLGDAVIGSLSPDAHMGDIVVNCHDGKVVARWNGSSSVDVFVINTNPL